MALNVVLIGWCGFECFLIGWCDFECWIDRLVCL